MPEIPDQFPETTDNLDAETRAIRTLNDNLRTSFSGGRVVMTQGVQALADDTITRVFKAVRDFDDFTPDNDPYKTHEFGMVEVDGSKVMFKVDCYDRNLEYGSPDPADPSVTARVLTILLASEY
jgi:hypothetical protein